MKQLILLMIASLQFNALTENSLINRAKRLFAPEMFGRDGMWLADFDERKSFFRDYQQCDDADELKLLDNYLLDAITSFKFTISTNRVNDGVSTTAIEERRWIVDSLIRTIGRHRATTDICTKLAAYIGNLESVDFPDNLARTMFNVVIFDENERKRVYKRIEELKPERELQARVSEIKCEVRQYQFTVLSRCADMMAELQKSMSQEKFASFTNEVARLSKASDSWWDGISRIVGDMESKRRREHEIMSEHGRKLMAWGNIPEAEENDCNTKWKMPKHFVVGDKEYCLRTDKRGSMYVTAADDNHTDIMYGKFGGGETANDARRMMLATIWSSCSDEEVEIRDNQAVVKRLKASVCDDDGEELLEVRSIPSAKYYMLAKGNFWMWCYAFNPEEEEIARAIFRAALVE